MSIEISEIPGTDQLGLVRDTEATTEDNEEVGQTTNGSHSQEAVLKFDELCGHTNDLFSRILQLPVYSSDSSRWKSLFYTAFSQFDVLWRYQQEQRPALDLRRYQIGEIGSRIAHLYLLYYLHTSLVKYLRESFAFYDAILKRDYFDTDVQREVEASGLMSRKLRTFCRAIQTAFFLENFTSVQDYLTRLSEFVQQTAGTKDSAPAEYTHVLSELSLFLSSVCLPISDEGALETSPFETLPAHVPPVPTDYPALHLERAVLVGANRKQSRLVDFSIDHYRMLCLLERVGAARLTHFHKLSTFSLLEALSGISDCLPPSQVLLLYISGECAGATTHTASHPSYATNCILLPPHSDQLFLEDLYPYLRRPLFLLIDCPGLLPHTELSFPDRFHHPLICLLSPACYPTTIENSMTRGGGLLTLFLASPLCGLCLICGISLTTKLSRAALQQITRIEDIALSTLSGLPNVPLPYKQLSTDNTLQCLVKRFLLFWACLRIHLGFKKECLPRCYPAIPPALFHSSYLNTELYELFSLLDVTEMFMSSAQAAEL